METYLLRVFQAQVRLQCHGILKAAHTLQTTLVAYDAADPAQDAFELFDDVWIAIQNLLGAAANVQKALWGQGGSLAAQRAPLRASLDVADDSPLREVDMRNNFEHFDDRLDTWWKTSKRHNFHDTLGPLDSVGGVDDIDLIRVYDPATTDLFFWGKRFNLGAIEAEAARVWGIARLEARKPHWDPAD